MYKGNKGFTLIELLVVIAIIGILSGIVLTSLNSARGKATDAKIKADLAGARSAAEVFYTTANTYTGLCSDPTFAPYSKNSDGSAKQGWACNVASGGQAYALSATLPNTATPNNYCVDSVGTNETGSKVSVAAGVCQ